MKKKRLSEAQILLMVHLRELWPRAYIRTEYQFYANRKWRFDIAALVPCKYRKSDINSLAIEIDGGAWSQGRHTRGAGFIKDMEKLNTASALGWKIFRFTPQQVLSGEAKAFIEKYLGKDTQR